mgnify:CR=1 FL=1|tara:strand:- start:646 stop:1494 length:849 start_codon:yes stop_codon:yes gene_type:complete
MSKLIAYLNLIRFFNPIGFWLLLWPGLWGLFLSENMDISYFTIVVLGSFLTRSLGCAINDIIDIQYDKKVDRTKNRPLANGDLKIKDAFLLITILAAACLYLLSLTNTQTICLVLFIAIPMIVIYPLMKRFIAVPQLFLGATFGLSLPISYSMAEGYISLEIIFLYIGCIFWILAYDSYYALCDIEDDKKISINSSPIFFGADTQKAIMLFYGIFVLIIMMLAIQNNFELMFIGILFLLYQGYFQNQLAKEGRNLEAFKSNSHVGLVIAIILFMENQSGLYS